MNKFIKRLLFFTLILGAYLGANYIINEFIISQSSLPIKDSNIYIMGDSHTRRAINPDLFKSAVNISQQAEPYVITYWKLKQIIKTRKIDTLLLSFSPHNVSELNDRMFEDKKWSSEMFKRVYLINDFENVGDMVVDYKNFYKTYFFKMLLYPNFNHSTFIGSYFNNNISKPFDSDDVIDRHYFFNTEEFGISKTSTQFLEKIISLCKKNDIILFLVSTPLHTEYYKKIPKDIRHDFNELQKKFSAENVPVINFCQHDYENKYFFNSDHLNQDGATKFTNELITILKTERFEK